MIQVALTLKFVTVSNSFIINDQENSKKYVSKEMYARQFHVHS